MMKRVFAYLFMLFLLSACTSAYAQESVPTPVPTPVVAQKPTYTVERGDVTRTLRLTGRVAPINRQDLYFRSDGFAREVMVERGDRVQTGDLLARLDDPQKLEIEVMSAQLKLEEARFELEKLRNESPVNAGEAQVALVEAEQKLKDAQRKRNNLDYDRVSDPLIVEKAETDYMVAKQVLKEAQKVYNKLAHKKLTNPERMAALNALLDAKRERDRTLAIYNYYLLPASQAEIDMADANLALAEAEYAAALDTWERLKDGPDQFDLRVAEAAVADAEVQLKIAQEALENIELRAPFDGEILSIGLTPGTQVTAFRGVLTLADPNELEIVAFPTAEELRDIGVGQAVTVQLSSRPGDELSGSVRQVPFSGSGDEQEGEQDDQAIHLTLDDANIPITQGETASIVIQIETRPDVLWLPPAALRTFQGRDFVFIQENGIQRRVDVNIGLRSDERVEILSGLSEGQVVVGQ